MTALPSHACRPVLRSPRAGLYVTTDGRYSLARGHGRFQDVWTFHDHITGYMATYRGKRDAMAALCTALLAGTPKTSGGIDCSPGS